MSEPELQSRVAETEREIGELTSTVKSLANSVNTVARKVDLLSDRVSSSGRPDWGVLLLALGALAAFIVLHTKPINDMANRNHDLLMERLKQLPQDYKEFGQNIANLESVRAQVETAENLGHGNTSEIRELRRWLESQERWLEDVDQEGSRKWIGSDNQ